MSNTINSFSKIVFVLYIGFPENTSSTIVNVGTADRLSVLHNVLLQKKNLLFVTETISAEKTEGKINNF